MFTPGDGSRLVVYFVTGNVFGIVLEPARSVDLPENERPNTWIVKIGILDRDMAIDSPPPAEDFDNVIQELVRFLRSKGIEPMGRAADDNTSRLWP
jgi:hypothetical protein